MDRSKISDNMNERKVADPEQIEALSSPVRQDIVDTLLTGGAMSARELAGHLGVRSSSLYYHLGVLESVGLVDGETTERDDGRSERVYGIPEGRMVIQYRLDDPENRAAITKVVGSILRLARRDFERGFDHPDATVEGPTRNLRGARVQGWLDREEQATANALLDRLADLFLQRRDPEGRTPCALSWVITPLVDRAGGGG
jgi:DNA-binding transcriptional ArsR family regulator